MPRPSHFDGQVNETIVLRESVIPLLLPLLLLLREDTDSTLYSFLSVDSLHFLSCVLRPAHIAEQSLRLFQPTDLGSGAVMCC